MKVQTIEPAAPTTGQTWNTSAYAANGRFVANLAAPVVDLLASQPGEHILDIGCGDGALTEQLAATGAHLIGIDASESMIVAARTRAAAAPTPFAVEHHTAQSLPYQEAFDAAFSNAALHWIHRESQPAALAAIHRALRPGARFVAEMGGQGNIAAIRTALSSVLSPYGLDSEAIASSFFASPAEYRALLESAGFSVQSIELHPRPTPLPNGADGMTHWLNTFRNGVLDHLTPTDRTEALATTVALLRPILSDSGGHWTADYVRLRFHATRS
ncbi:class I SAM-dependent methyltransferase [Granulicella sibirica]|uniref:Methyltransferase type 11 n=1 Tax=Granulicella sibirica TaxID=2479048 RepID=A0A4Q0T4Z9_9BACT|nr:class I SAM-dependent methyltransferase [Granulicella sibirica]RXH57128.1 Methyltransferase type 11 [Granulicella sibirica]